MSRASSQMQEVAARLIAHEAKEQGALESNLPRAFHVCEKLRPYLATLMGKAGFRAVLSRALAVVRGEVAWLAAVQVNAEGALEGWDKLEARVAPEKLVEGGVLLVAFIGDNLTLRLVGDVWPKLVLEDLKFTHGDPL